MCSYLLASMTKDHLPCWIGVGTERLVKGRLVSISEKGARVLLPEITNLPPICHLFLNSDRSDGHQCQVEEQTGLLTRLKFLRPKKIPRKIAALRQR
jgi:hypothetical protein